jgi:Flp pilus assembly protein TadG
MYIVVFNATCQYTVTTVKYLGEEPADEGSFDIFFTWTADNFNNGNTDSTTIPLNSGNNWQHVSAAMDAGANFTVEESNVDADCDDEGDLYRLLGFGTGSTL